MVDPLRQLLLGGIRVGIPEDPDIPAAADLRPGAWLITQLIRQLPADHAEGLALGEYLRPFVLPPGDLRLRDSGDVSGHDQGVLHEVRFAARPLIFIGGVFHVAAFGHLCGPIVREAVEEAGMDLDILIQVPVGVPQEGEEADGEAEHQCQKQTEQQ